MTIAPQGSGIGRRVRAARERLGWSREALAFHSGISWSAIAQIESGRRRELRPGTLSALAGMLGVTVDYLVRGGPVSPAMLEHRALLYRTDEELATTAGAFLAEGLERDEPALAVTSDGNIELLREYLGTDADRVDFVEMAARFDTPAPILDAFREYAGPRLEAGAPWVRILGEPSWNGRSDSEIQLWTRHESLLNLVFAAWPITFICPYDQRSVPAAVLGQARCTHPQTIESGEIANSAEYADPGGFVL